MPAKKEKSVVAARFAKRRIENSLIEAGKTEKIITEADRQRNRRSIVKVMVEQNYEKARVEAERRSAIKITVEQKSAKARV